MVSVTVTGVVPALNLVIGTNPETALLLDQKCILNFK